ncbi:MULTISPECIES: hypothetical protein [Proteus]|uniref:Uncharacterized protein n=1 Tax=Proteus columbae TaxID=1987580 RepID=A0A6I7CZY5_9GAMM|nr:hypothetical protein [Proteus columbae]QHN10201.1 hypothetical protein F1325_06900 [Proteus columbae]
MTENKTSAIKFYNEIVKPTVDDFLHERTSIRKGFLAAIVINHIKDYLYDNYGKKDIKTKINASLYAECPHLNTISDICNAAKHHVLSNKRSVIKSSEQVSQTNIPSLFEVPFGEGGFSEASEVFIVLDKTNENIHYYHLPTIVTSAVNFWETKLNQ